MENITFSSVVFLCPFSSFHRQTDYLTIIHVWYSGQLIDRYACQISPQRTVYQAVSHYQYAFSFVMLPDIFQTFSSTFVKHFTCFSISRQMCPVYRVERKSGPASQSISRNRGVVCHGRLYRLQQDELCQSPAASHCSV